LLAELTFFAMSALVLVSAWMVLRTVELVHATVWLAMMMLGVAGVFLTLGAEFLATIQVLVYVGAVITLILFTVMLTIPVEHPDVLDDLPPGIHVESVEDLQKAIPSFTGAGPWKDLQDTNPRKPQRKPDTLYGVNLTDDEIATDTSPSTKDVVK
jgi:hypothetical protein